MAKFGYTRCLRGENRVPFISVTAKAPDRHLIGQRRPSPDAGHFAPDIPDFGYKPPKRYPNIVPTYPKMARLLDHNDQPPPRGSCLSSRRRRARTVCVKSMIKFILDYLVRFSLCCSAESTAHKNYRSPSLSFPLLSPDQI